MVSGGGRSAGHKRTCGRGCRLRQQSGPCQDANQESQMPILAHKTQNCTGYPLLCLPAKTGRYRAEFVAVLAETLGKDGHPNRLVKQRDVYSPNAWSRTPQWLLSHHLGHGLGTRPDLQLPIDVADVKMHCVIADLQLLPDLLVRKASDQLVKN